MNYESMYWAILHTVKSRPTLQAHNDLNSCLINWTKDNEELARSHVDEVLSAHNEAMIRYSTDGDYEEAEKYRRLMYLLLLFDAPYSFDHYMQALEFDRKPQDRFYLPRRRVLLDHVKALQDLADNKLDELFLSQPPRTGKTLLLEFFYTWILGKNSEFSNLYVSFSDNLTTSFYNGILEVIEDANTYHWHAIFPRAKLVQTNAKDETINIDRKKKYPSLTCRSLYGTLNGACDCNGFLVADDLLSGIEEAVSIDRLASAWNHVDNNMLTRAKASAKILWIGTRWSIVDPIGRRLELLRSDPKFENYRYKIINIPALDDKDESNFDYKFNVGFTSEYFQQRRSSFEFNNDMASWFAQYQGEPIEREGTVFTVDGFKYYNGTLPEGDPDRIFMAVDPAFGGGDYTAAPIVYQYGEDYYVHDVIYDDSEKTITQPLIARKARDHCIQALQIEATKAIQPYVEGVEKELEKIGYRMSIISKAAPNNQSKHERILDKAGDIRKYFFFLDSQHRTKEYNMFMQNVFAYKIVGKNKHDDAPDSLAIATTMAFRTVTAKVEIFSRPF